MIVPELDVTVAVEADKTPSPSLEFAVPLISPVLATLAAPTDLMAAAAAVAVLVAVIVPSLATVEPWPDRTA